MSKVNILSSFKNNIAPSNNESGLSFQIKRRNVEDINSNFFLIPKQDIAFYEDYDDDEFDDDDDD